MRDIHCHILPGLDDGSPDMAHSLAMLEAAKAAGVTSMICTPHCRDPYFDYDRMQAAFAAFQGAAGGFPVEMGFEVAHAKLRQLGVHRWAPRLGLGSTGMFLLELDVGCVTDDFADYERTIYELQGMGYRVVIAHPERYDAIRRDVSLAQRLVDLDCDLQASADFVRGGRLGNSRRTARKIYKRGLYTYIASDAHRPEHYQMLAEALRDYPLEGAPRGRHFRL